MTAAAQSPDADVVSAAQPATVLCAAAIAGPRTMSLHLASTAPSSKASPCRFSGTRIAPSRETRMQGTWMRRRGGGGPASIKGDVAASVPIRRRPQQRAEPSPRSPRDFLLASVRRRYPVLGLDRSASVCAYLCWV